MEKEQFEKGKELEQRILQLTLIKKYMESFLAGDPFTVKLEVSVLGHCTGNLFPINGKSETYRNFQDTEDAKYIIKSLQDRIDSVQIEFDNL